MPNLVALAAPVPVLSEADIEQHLRAIRERTGFDLLGFWRSASKAELGAV